MIIRSIPPSNLPDSIVSCNFSITSIICKTLDGEAYEEREELDGTALFSIGNGEVITISFSDCEFLFKNPGDDEYSNDLSLLIGDRTDSIYRLPETCKWFVSTYPISCQLAQKAALTVILCKKNGGLESIFHQVDKNVVLIIARFVWKSRTDIIGWVGDC